jgi:hypothetical protein
MLGYNRVMLLAVGKVQGEIKSSRKKIYLQQQLSMSCNSQFLNNGRKGRAFIPVFDIMVNLFMNQNV